MGGAIIMWYFDPNGSTMDVYDHTGTKVASHTPIAFDGDGNPISRWTGDFPNRVKDIARQELQGE